MDTSLTPEQKARIEENRKLALEKRAARLSQIKLSNSLQKLPETVSHPVSSVNSHNNKSLSVISSSNETKCIKPTNVNSLSNNLNANGQNVFSMDKKDKSNVAVRSSSTPTSINSPKKLVSSYSPLDLNYVKPIKPETHSSPQKQGKLNLGVTQGKPQTPVVGTCKLISRERFTVDIIYQQQAIDLFRTIQGKEYDPKTKLWTFPIAEYFNLKKAINVLKPYVVVGDLPRCVIETFIRKASTYQQDTSKVDLSQLDPKLRQTIYPFQQEGIQYGVSRGGRCLIADEMGLGKSIQALGIADYYRSDWPLLIVCPSSMRFQWEEEIRVNLPNSVHTHQVFVMSTGRDIVDGARVLILSYDLLSKKREMIKEMGFGVVIMDESHSIKSIKTQRGKVALEVAENCKRVILLSGTPVLSRPSELYTQIRAVDPTAFPYFKEYGMRYCNGNETRFGWDFSGSSNMEELKLLLETRFMIRRLKSSVLGQLPSKIRQVIVLKSKSLNKTNESMDAFALKLQSSTLKGMERHGTLLSYFSETSKTKAPAVCEYITDFLQDNRKCLCFAHHAEMLNAISETLEKNKIYYIRIDGAVSAEDRKTLCDKFQYEEKWKVAVLSIKAANTGLTLTAAQVVIFAELFWNPGDLAQAEDRVHRIGQEDCVVVKYLIAKGTADDYLWPLIQSKLEVLNKAGLSKDSYMDADTKYVNEPEKKETQTKINQFFQHFLSDDDDDELSSIMDEIEGVQPKKMKVDN